MRKTVDRHIRFDEATAELMRKRSAELHIKDSEYVRRLIRQDSYQMDREILKDMIRDISGMGNNANQIARVANTTLEVTPEDIRTIEEFKRELFEFRKEVVRLRKMVEGGGT